MNKKKYRILLRIAGHFFSRHRTKVNSVLVFSPPVLLIPVLSYGVLYPEAEMSFSFWLFLFAIILFFNPEPFPMIPAESMKWPAFKNGRNVMLRDESKQKINNQYPFF